MVTNTQEKLEQILDSAVDLVENGERVKYKLDITIYGVLTKREKRNFVFQQNDETARQFFIRDDYFESGARVAYEALERINECGFIDSLPKSSEELVRIISTYQNSESIEEFVESVADARDENKNRYDFFRSILLLKTLEKHPDKIRNIEENSIYFPQRLFVSHKLAKDKKRQERFEIAIVDLYSNDLVERISKFDELIDITGRGNNDWSFPNSKYDTYFTKKEGCSDERIEELYCSINVKREIIKTLYDCFNIFGKLNNYKNNMKKLPKEFRITKGKFFSGKDLIERFAKNQLMKVFDEKEVAVSTYLSQSLGYESRVENERLYITHGYNTSNFCKENKRFNTTNNLLNCVDILNKLYSSALDIIKEEDDEYSQESSE